LWQGIGLSHLDFLSANLRQSTRILGSLSENSRGLADESIEGLSNAIALGKARMMRF
jgi:hypothetical protein